MTLRRRAVPVALAAGLLAAAVIPMLAVRGDEGGKAGPSPYIGSARCKLCHADAAQGFAATSHRILASDKVSIGCEACHGPARAHTEAETKETILGFGEGRDPAKQAKACLSCHRSGPEHVTAWEASSFAKEGKTCSSCHTIHAASDRSISLPAKNGYLGNTACRLCHGSVVESFGRIFHAAAAASDEVPGCELCHGPAEKHPATARSLLAGGGDSTLQRRPSEERCLGCHRDAPAWHAKEVPVAAEKPGIACLTCHGTQAAHTDRRTPPWDGSVAAFTTLEGARKAATPVGRDTCSTCHVKAIETHGMSAHGPALADRADACESCHGPASLHAATGGKPAYILDLPALAKDEASRICLTCHETQGPDHAKGWWGSANQKSGKSCLICHRSHGGPTAEMGSPIETLADARARATYVGSATCAGCHEAPHPDLPRSPHAKLMNEERGCELCHGPGSLHASSAGTKEAILGPERVKPAAFSQVCLECHGASASRSSWRRSDHAVAGQGCLACHSPVAPVSGARDAQLATCSTCHRDVAAQFRLPNHHRVPEGSVKCSDCHDVHGSSTSLRARRQRVEACAKCHPAEAAVNVYEHEASRLEGCLACHVPHGSTTRRLLTQRDVRTLCIQCHVTPISHDLSSGSIFRNCVRCHTQVHGSDSDPKLFR